jgi:acyl-CoA dehydrogenase
VVWATIDKSAGRGGIKSFLIEKGTPGFVVAHKESSGSAPTTRQPTVQGRCIALEPAGRQRNGSEGSSGGFKDVMKRSTDAAGGVGDGPGMAEAALFTREQLAKAGVVIEYGLGLHGQTAVAEKFLRLETLFEAAKLTILRAAWLADGGKPNNLESSVCKAKTGAAVREITQGCIEILGPMGISRQHLLEKWFRDVRITDIYEGTGEIQRLILARSLLGYSRDELTTRPSREGDPRREAGGRGGAGAGRGPAPLVPGPRESASRRLP